MQTVLASLLATVLSIHAVLGCCWHHAQACTDSASGVDHGCGLSCCHETAGATGHGDECGDDHGDPLRAPCSGECHASCIYWGGSKSTVGDWQPKFAVNVALAVDGSLPGRMLVAAASVDHRVSPPPLRLHLLQHVLLI